MPSAAPLKGLARLPLAIGLVAGLPVLALAGYDKPPEPLLGVMHAPLPATPMLDPTRQRMLLVEQSQYPPVARVAERTSDLEGLNRRLKQEVLERYFHYRLRTLAYFCRILPST